jgi:hypothetical protein
MSHRFGFGRRHASGRGVRGRPDRSRRRKRRDHNHFGTPRGPRPCRRRRPDALALRDVRGPTRRRARLDLATLRRGNSQRIRCGTQHRGKGRRQLQGLAGLFLAGAGVSPPGLRPAGEHRFSRGRRGRAGKPESAARDVRTTRRPGGGGRLRHGPDRGQEGHSGGLPWFSSPTTSPSPGPSPTGSR